MKLMNGFSCIRKGTLIQTLKPRSIMLLFSGVYFVSYLTRINYAAVISAIIADEKISASYAAVAVTGAFVTYGAGQPCERVAERQGSAVKAGCGGAYCNIGCKFIRSVLQHVGTECRMVHKRCGAGVYLAAPCAHGA